MKKLTALLIIFALAVNVRSGNAVTGTAGYVLNVNSNMDTSGFRSNVSGGNSTVISGEVLNNGGYKNGNFSLNVRYDDGNRNIQIGNINIPLSQ